jgi:excisionase family DNA binding protein
MNELLMSIPEAAEYLDIGTNTMRKLLNNETITHFRVAEKIIRIPKGALDDYLASVRVEGMY